MVRLFLETVNLSRKFPVIVLWITMINKKKLESVVKRAHLWIVSFISVYVPFSPLEAPSLPWVQNFNTQYVSVVPGENGTKYAKSDQMQDFWKFKSITDWNRILINCSTDILIGRSHWIRNSADNKKTSVPIPNTTLPYDIKKHNEASINNFFGCHRQKKERKEKKSEKATETMEKTRFAVPCGMHVSTVSPPLGPTNHPNGTNLLTSQSPKRSPYPQIREKEREGESGSELLF